ncbi:MAG: helix-turn-helix domain-containing protein [Cyclobacteriaceae bacterium]
MEKLKYRVIKSREQYDEYCASLEQLAFQEHRTVQVEEEMELLTVLIEKYDQENNSFDEMDPITLLRSLMTDHNLKAKDLVNLLGVSKGLVSDILSYRKSLSKEVIRKLADHFSLHQEAFNRPYPLQNVSSSGAKSRKKANSVLIKS